VFLHEVTPVISRGDTDEAGGPRGGRRALYHVKRSSSFAPLDLLTHPADFGREINVTWRRATSLDEAPRLSRSIDQHLQSLGMDRILRRGRYSVSDLARALVERPESVLDKLRGRAPAPERDLVLWSWMSGTPRVQVPLSEIANPPEGQRPEALLPDLGEPARIVVQRLRAERENVECEAEARRL